MFFLLIIEAESLSMLPVSHSFIRRLASYVLLSGTMNLGLDEGDCAKTFVHPIRPAEVSTFPVSSRRR